MAVYNPEVENTIIATILFEGEEFLISALEKGLAGKHFYDEVNRLIYNTLKRKWETGRYSKIDYIVAIEILKEEGVISEKISEAELFERYSASFIKDPSLFEEYCEIQKNLYLKKELVEIAKEVISSTKDPRELANEIVTKVLKISQETDTVEVKPFAVASEEYLEKIEIFKNNKSIITGLPSGIPDLDRLTTGFHEGELIIVAGRPGMGKSSFGLTVAKNLFLSDIPVAYFSLEMSTEQLIGRLFSMLSKIPLQDLRTGRITDEQLEILKATKEELKDKPLFIVDKAGLSISELRAKALQLKREYGIELIIIDYLQLLRSGVKHFTRQEEVAEISRSLKALAKELEIPVIALAQLSRQVEHRSDKRPQLTDLRESGQIEQDADLIIFLHRPEYYLKIKKKEVPVDLLGKVEIIVAKQRQGAQGVIEALFIEKISSIEPKDEDFDKEIEEDIFGDDDFLDDIDIDNLL